MVTQSKFFSEKMMISSVAKEPPLVSVVILSYNRKDDLDLSLANVQKLSYPDLEIVVVDNASVDGTADMVLKKYPEVKLILLPRNIGIEGFNVGCLNARGKYILVLDDDSYPHPDAVSELVKKMEIDENIAVIGAKIINPQDGKVCTKGPDSHEIPFTSFWGGGALLRRKAVIECGMYDHRLFVYTNEYDLSVRLLKAGYSVRYDPSVVIYHRFSPVARFSKTKWYWGRNEIWFNLRHMPLRYLPMTLPRSFMWMLMLSRHSAKEMCYQILGMLNGFLSFSYSERKPVKRDLAVLLLRNHWTFVPPIKFICNYLSRKSLSGSMGETESTSTLGK
jgi:GT2 family glycosyltransferase